MHNWSQWEPPNHPNSQCGPVWHLLFDHSTNNAHSLSHWLANEKLMASRPMVTEQLAPSSSCPSFHLFPLPTEMPLQSSWGPEVRRVGCFCCQASCAWEQRQTNRQRWRRGQRGGSLLLAWHRLILTQLKSGQKWFNYGIGPWNGWKMQILYMFMWGESTPEQTAVSALCQNADLWCPHNVRDQNMQEAVSWQAALYAACSPQHVS